MKWSAHVNFAQNLVQNYCKTFENETEYVYFDKNMYMYVTQTSVVTNEKS